ncbi:MAG: CotS family spore coat protein [Bacillota bacterium]
MASNKPLPIAQIEKNYPFTIRGVKERERDWLLETNEGNMILRLARSNEAEQLFVYSIRNHLQEKGFQGLVSMYPAKDGKLYCKVNDELFQVAGCSKHQEIKFKNKGDLAAVVKLTAEFHQSSQTFKAIPGSKVKTEWGRWMWTFKAYCSLGHKLGQIIKAKDRKEKAEKLFLESLEQQLERGEACIHILKETPYLDIVKDSMDKNELCINNFQEKNFCKDKEQTVNIISLEDVKHDTRSVDVANLLMANSKAPERIHNILQMYHQLYPLSSDEIKIIKAYVQFPLEYFRVVDKYYRNKKELTDSYWLKRFKKAIDFEKTKDRFRTIDFHGVVKQCDGVMGDVQGRDC